MLPRTPRAVPRELAAPILIAHVEPETRDAASFAAELDDLAQRYDHEGRRLEAEAADARAAASACRAWAQGVRAGAEVP